MQLDPLSNLVKNHLIMTLTNVITKQVKTLVSGILSLQFPSPIQDGVEAAVKDLSNNQCVNLVENIQMYNTAALLTKPYNNTIPNSKDEITVGPAFCYVGSGSEK